MTTSLDGSLCASGGKDTKDMLWDLNDKHHYTLDHADHAWTFSPNSLPSLDPTIKIWDLESKNMEEVRPEVPGRHHRHGHQKCLLSHEWPWRKETGFKCTLTKDRK